MCASRVLLLLLSLFLTNKCLSETCEETPIELIVYEEIDSAGETVSLKDLDIDVFHILITNQSLKAICQNQISLDIETSIIQIINASVSDIEPGAFNITVKLALLKISRNPITEIKSGVFNDLKVKELDLSNNFIASIEPEAFDHNAYLEIVTLNNNAIKEFDPNMFKDSPNVYKLSMIFNELTQIPAGAFKYLSKSRPLKLIFSANRIFEIDPHAFDGHDNIDIFKVNGNKLTDLSEHIFKNRSFRNIQINTNTLECFPDSIFETGLESLEFLENPDFECACLQKVRKFVEENGIKIVYPAIICEDKARQVNVVYNFNRTHEIPLLPPSLVVEATGAKPGETQADEQLLLTVPSWSSATIGRCGCLVSCPLPNTIVSVPFTEQQDGRISTGAVFEMQGFRNLILKPEYGLIFVNKPNAEM